MKRLLKVREVSQITGVGRSQIYDLMKSGRFPR
ncbi:MAG: helix-turn-helix transcriptional regulator, partial [Gammaproteobacteria bacterium]